MRGSRWCVALLWLLPAWGWSCTLGAERWIEGCEVGCVASRDGSTCPKSCLARPEEGEIILDHRIEILGQSNGTHSLARVPGDHAERYRERIETAYGRLIALSRERAPERLASLAQEREAQLARLVSGEGRDLLKLTVDASRGGTLYAPRRGFSRARLMVRLLCLAPPDLERQLADRLALSSP